MHITRLDSNWLIFSYFFSEKWEVKDEIGAIGAEDFLQWGRRFSAPTGYWNKWRNAWYGRLKIQGIDTGHARKGLERKSPQGCYSAPRTWRGKPDPPIFSGGCTQKKIQDPNTKIQIPRIAPTNLE